MKQKKSKITFILITMLIFVLSFLLYYQWTTKTNVYMKSHGSLVAYVGKLQHSIHLYLQDENPLHLHRVNDYAQVISIQAGIFQFFYRNQFGRELSDNFQTIFSSSNFNLKEDKETRNELKKWLDYVERIESNLHQGSGTLQYASRYSIIPSNPYTKSRMEKVLETTQEILQEINDDE